MAWIYQGASGMDPFDIFREAFGVEEEFLKIFLKQHATQVGLKQDLTSAMI